MADKEARFAANELGSNGIRMVVARLNGGGTIRSIHSERKSIRFGAHAFDQGCFEASTRSRVVDIFEQFRQTLTAHGTHQVRAVATSAAREAANVDELIAAVHDVTGISIDIIDSLTEAQMILDAVSAYTDPRGTTAARRDASRTARSACSSPWPARGVEG